MQRLGAARGRAEASVLARARHSGPTQSCLCNCSFGFTSHWLGFGLFVCASATKSKLFSGSSSRIRCAGNRGKIRFGCMHSLLGALTEGLDQRAGGRDRRFPGGNRRLGTGGGVLRKIVDERLHAAIVGIGLSLPDLDEF